MEKGLVSIIIPCFNAEDYLYECLSSVANQTYSKIEVLLLDDGSSDRSIDVALKFLNRINIKIFGPYDHIGPFALRNIGVAECKGEYVAFLDADDVWAQKKLQRQVEILENNEGIGLCHTAVRDIDKLGRDLGASNSDRSLYSGYCFAKLLTKNGIANSSVLARRAVFERLGGFDEEFRLRGDWEMWVRIAKEYEVGYSKEEDTMYRLHDSNVSRDLVKVRYYAMKIVDKFERLYSGDECGVKDELKNARINTHRAYGLMALVDRNFRIARQDLLIAWKGKPSDMKVAVAYLKCIVYPLIGKR